jgi:hypothetical protein
MQMKKVVSNRSDAMAAAGQSRNRSSAGMLVRQAPGGSRATAM